VGGVQRRVLSLVDLAALLLAQPDRSMPAILALTATTDHKRATAIVRGWTNRSTDGQRQVIPLMAADISGRAAPVPPRRAATRNRDGSISTVSGGLPGLGKRR
jgi:hypothetical protein